MGKVIQLFNRIDPPDPNPYDSPLCAYCMDSPCQCEPDYCDCCGKTLTESDRNGRCVDCLLGWGHTPLATVKKIVAITLLVMGAQYVEES